MPSFEILINKKLLTIADASDVDVMNLGIINTPASKDFFMQLSSMKKESGSHVFLINRRLSENDTITLALRRDYAKPLDLVNIEEPKEVIDVNYQRSKPVNLLLSSGLSNRQIFHASVTDESSLHFAATWLKTQQKCMVEVVAMKVVKDGQNEMWMEYHLDYDQPVEIILNSYP